MPRPKILVVEDDDDARERLCSILIRRINCAVEAVVAGQEALDKIKAEDFDLVLLDIKMPGLSGIDVLKQAKKLKPLMKIIVISGYDSVDIASAVLEAGAHDYIPKPQPAEAMELKIKQVLGLA